LILDGKLQAQYSPRQLTRRVVPPPNNTPPAPAPAAKPAPAQPAAPATATNLAVPTPPPPADPEKAKQETLKRTIEFLKKRVTEGSPSGEYELGLHYLKGEGVEKDEAKGRELLEQSAKNDYTLAKNKLEELDAKKKK